MFSQACRRLSRDILFSLNVRHRCKPEPSVCNVISRLSLRRCGCRAGKRCRLRLLAAQTVTSSVRPSHFAGEIPTIIGNRKQSVAADQLFDGRDARSSVLRRIHRRNPLIIIRVGLLNWYTTNAPTSSSGSAVRS